MSRGDAPTSCRALKGTRFDLFAQVLQSQRKIYRHLMHPTVEKPRPQSPELRGDRIDSSASSEGGSRAGMLELLRERGVLAQHLVFPLAHLSYSRQ